MPLAGGYLVEVASLRGAGPERKASFLSSFSVGEQVVIRQGDRRGQCVEGVEARGGVRSLLSWRTWTPKRTSPTPAPSAR